VIRGIWSSHGVVKGGVLERNGHWWDGGYLVGMDKWAGLTRRSTGRSITEVDLVCALKHPAIASARRRNTERVHRTTAMRKTVLLTH
jgi:hypothetical protein